MAGNFSPQLLDEIRARVDLVDLIGEYVPLKRAGENWKARCPFHAEKTPSFNVNPRKGIYHCFGCGAGGDAFGFLMRQDRLQFPEAVKFLADRVGVELPRGREPEAVSRHEPLFRALSLAQSFYEEALWKGSEGEKARRYFENRGIEADVARRFGLGYAPQGWDHLLEWSRRQGVKAEELHAAGLVVPRQEGSGYYDRFRGRLIFPIRDLRGRVIAFGGRALGPEEPKYLNSPETTLYVKGQTLYALDLAKTAIRERERGLIVEGYIDCLMAHQHGFTETVAALGTAFTGSQLQLLHRYTDEVITFFDADAAGEKAAQRAEELLEPSGAGLAWAVNRSGSFGGEGSVRLKVALLPSGEDPDTFLRKEGSAAFRERIGNARSILAYSIEKALAEEDTSKSRGRASAFARVALILSKVQDAQEASELAREAARKLSVDQTQLWIEAQTLQRSRQKSISRAPDPGPRTPNLPPTERDLLALLVHSVEARQTLLPILEVEDLTHPVLRGILEGLKRWPELTPHQLMGELSETHQGHLAALLLQENLEVEQAILEYKRRAEMRRRTGEIRQVTQAIVKAQAEGEPRREALDGELEALQRQARELRELAAQRGKRSGG